MSINERDYMRNTRRRANGNKPQKTEEVPFVASIKFRLWLIYRKWFRRKK